MHNEPIGTAFNVIMGLLRHIPRSLENREENPEWHQAMNAARELIPCISAEREGTLRL